MNQARIGSTRDVADDQMARWGRSRHEGYQHFFQRYVQSPPLLFTQDHHPLWLGDIYRGRSAFLIGGGPSFAGIDSTLLRQPGVLTMGLNNSAKSFRPNLWVSVDRPDHFLRSVWLDATIMKFVPICHADKKVFDSDRWRFTDLRVGDCPNVVYYKRNEQFQPEQFLWEDCINWGNHGRLGGGRSVMLAAIRLLFILGIRRVYLLGVDFKMDEKTHYHFEQGRKLDSIKGNNATYQRLNEWFGVLRPLFEKEEFFIHNCNPESNLKAFDHVPFETALKAVLGTEMDGIDVKSERTRGLYDVSVRDKELGRGK